MINISWVRKAHGDSDFHPPPLETRAPVSVSGATRGVGGGKTNAGSVYNLGRRKYGPPEGKWNKHGGGGRYLVWEGTGMPCITSPVAGSQALPVRPRADDGGCDPQISACAIRQHMDDEAEDWPAFRESPVDLPPKPAGGA
ncbi:hypothetical protein CYMTET_50221 [Cymbomonas tetramitiformis]|uniref:Uncharacterized protein n=1 Tax=Cymbomonas tetramitiformis TaxID=36881 RepID=A0AAE0ET24_9CHLO|nr:hypothetical protein CYMTET_50221 [Cymbomonas tetramitiformis]